MSEHRTVAGDDLNPDPPKNGPKIRLCMLLLLNTIRSFNDTFCIQKR